MIKTKNYISGSDWWVDSESLSFSEILVQSNVPEKWARYNSKNILSLQSIIKPVNEYVFNLYPRPQIINVKNNKVTFRQRTHAEIWVEEKNNDVLYALDKCHQRQFYPSSNNLENPKCFKPTYRFYVPWFINKDTEVSFSPIEDEKTPFFINTSIFIGKTLSGSELHADTDFIDFKIKNTGNYHLKEKYAIISKNTAMYDMSVLLTKEEIDKIEKDYNNG